MNIKWHPYYTPTEQERQVLKIAADDKDGLIRTGGAWSVRDVCKRLVHRGLLVQLSYTTFCLPA